MSEFENKMKELAVKEQEFDELMELFDKVDMSNIPSKEVDILNSIMEKYEVANKIADNIGMQLEQQMKKIIVIDGLKKGDI